MDLLKPWFPLITVQSVVNIFEDQVNSNRPNLAALSIIAGFFERQLTNPKTTTGVKLLHFNESFPILEWEVFVEMLEKYYRLIESCLGDLNIPQKLLQSDLGLDKNGPSSDEQQVMVKTKDAAEQGRHQVKRIADFVWSFLSTSFFKDRPHLQTVYSFLNDKRLDCFGIAFVVVASAQYLGLDHIHLSLSEDHAWVTYGPHLEETAEVTWHGKGNKEKRGNPINKDNSIEFEKDWLYLGGHEVKCDRKTEVAAIVSTLNPGINSKTDSEILGKIQQELLWMLYKNGQLKKYPMAVCNLADLEEIENSKKETSIDDLYREAIEISEAEYNGYHVYPYTYYGGYLYRMDRLREATEMWCKAAQAASRFTHSQQDEELYKDLHEIANTFFPSIVKRHKSTSLTEKVEDHYFESSENCRNILNFYDGVCLWEQDGYTSAIHSEWAKNFCKIMSNFSCELRIRIIQEFVDLKAFKDARQVCFPRSEKMKLLINTIGLDRINSQTVSLHLTSRVGLKSGKHSNFKSTSDFLQANEVPSAKRARKR